MNNKRALLNEIYSEKFLSYWVTPHTIFSSRRKINEQVETLFFRFLRELPSKALSVGDVGTYYGAALFYFLSKTLSLPITFTGYDVDAAKLTYANAYKKELKTKQLQQRLSFAQHNIEKAPLPQQHDVLLCIETIEHVHDVHKSLQHLFASLKPGGFLIISTPNKRNLLSYLFPFKKVAHDDHDDHEKAGDDIADKLFGAAIPDLDGDKHWSVMSLGALKRSLRSTGFTLRTLRRGPLVYGGHFFDKHAFMTALATVFDELLSILHIGKRATFDFILVAQKKL